MTARTSTGTIPPSTGLSKPYNLLESDTAAVLIWLRSHAGREVTYREIGAGTGIPMGGRLQRAVRHVRLTAEHLGGHRLERFHSSRDPRRQRASVTRFTLSGQGDEFSAEDALHASRLAITAMEDMRRSCRYEAGNIHGSTPETYAKMADAVEGCIQTVSGVTDLGVAVRRLKNENLALSQRIAQLEARLDHSGAPETDVETDPLAATG